MNVVEVSQRGAARWRRGHPWIYRADLIGQPNLPAGVVAVVDPRGLFLGQALWSPTSTITLRFLTAAEVPIDETFWVQRLRSARQLRDALAPDANAWRVVHGEADGLPSLVVDRYDELLVVQLLSAGLEARRSELLEALVSVFEPRGLLLRNDVPVRRHENLELGVERVLGEVPEQIEVREGRVRYLAAPWSGQKTGAFLDQRENRVRAGALAFGRALDCFCYHGSFALHLKGGAHEVTAVDSSREALERAELNARINGAEIRFHEANVFEFLRAEESAGSRYETIVLDPPAFAKRRDSVPAALRGYKEVNLRAMRLLAPGGYLCTFSCSYHIGPALFREMLEGAAADAGRQLRWIETRGQARDHPEILQIPETAYLKGAILQAV
jgi:23S rRNA (cytosine1962-C5)-methyltransferase